MKDIKAIRGRNHILALIEEGEHEHQDFKFAISDARKIARSISAFANNDGGHLLVGVKDNGVPAGIRNEEDIYMIETAAEIYCEPKVEVEITAYKVEPEIIVLKAEIPRALRPPVKVKEEDGKQKAYFRVRDENLAAPEMLLKAWEFYASPDGALLRLDARQQRLIAMIEEQGCVTFDQYLTATHSSRRQALELIGRLIATSVVNLSHDGSSFVLTL